MFNIFCHQGHKNQNNIKILSHLSQNGNHQENEKQQMLAEIGGWVLYTVGGNVN
jgi:hypothetical protein